MLKLPFRTRLARTLAFALLTWLSSSAPGRASAQAPSDAPDVVVLADGGFVRGTLVEHAPGQYAVLLTLGGQLRRFEAKDLSYVGPAQGMPRPAPAPTPPAANPSGTPPVNTQAPSPTAAPEALPSDASVMVEVRFEATQPVEVLERNGVSTSANGMATGESYAPLCTAPCVTTLRPGTYTLGLAQPGGHPVRAGSLMLRQGSVVRAHYDSRLSVRVGGIFIAIGGIGGGLALMLGSIDDGGTIGGQFWAGAILSGVGTLVGLLMGRIPDSADVQATR